MTQTTIAEAPGGAWSGYVVVNGLDMYYEVHGQGQPLVLLHGGLCTIEAWGTLLPVLAEGAQVIAVELQGHGRTADIARPMSYEGMADDVAALIEALGVAPASVLGYSLGGGVALQTAIRHPDVVRKLVLLSTTFKRDGWSPAALAGQSAVNAEAARGWVGSPMQQAYAAVAPRPEDWPALAGKAGDLLRQDYDWGIEVAAIKAPALIVVGDADAVRHAATLELFELLGGGSVDGGMTALPSARLAVLPATTHMETPYRVELLAAIVPAFLDAPTGAGEQDV